ncbi:MAG: hypothetical protein J0I06_16575 [Planctomycetes bacterium]|nr:hypothetical protein [Planctomycetota bacterium]
MPIRITCPSCSATLSVRDEYAGRAVKCPKCAGLIPPTAQPVPTVSEPEAVATIPSPPPPPAPPAPESLDLPPEEPAAAPPPRAVATAAPPAAPERSPFESLDEPEKPAKTGSKVTGRPADRSREDGEDDRPRRTRRDDEDDRPRPRNRRDDEDEDDRSRRTRRDDENDRDEGSRKRGRDDEDDRPRRKRRDDDGDDRPAYGRKRGGGNGGVIVAIVGGALLLIGGGGALAWFLNSKDDKDGEGTEKPNATVTRANFNELKVGATTRAQAEQLFGKGREATGEDVAKMLGADAAAIDKWTPMAAKGRAVIWQSGTDYVLAAFHPSAEADARLQMKEWRSKGSVNASAGDASDIAFLSKYPPAGKGDELSGPAVAATGAELAQAYKEDRAAADTKYKDKVVTVEGSLEDIDLLPDGTMQVRIVGVGDAGAGGIVPRVGVQPGEMGKVLNLSRLQTVKFKGRCVGLNRSFVDVTNARVEGRPGPDPSFEVGVTALLSMYSEDERKADERFKGRHLTVSGAEVESKTADAVYLVSRKSKALRVKMVLAPEFRKLFDGIPVGRAVKVKGECGGKSGNEVLLNRGWLCP